MYTWLFSQLAQGDSEVSITPSTIASGSTAVDIHGPHMDARDDYLLSHQETASNVVCYFLFLLPTVNITIKCFSQYQGRRQDF